MIEVYQLWKSYGERVAVADLNFAVGPGEILGFVGPNGAGKTSTLRVLAGILPPTAGVVRLAGIDLGHEPLRAKRELGFVPDTPFLYDELSVVEHLRLACRIHKVPKPDIDGLLDSLELTERRDDYPDALSRGMRQKVALAWALVHDPRVLLLDEPLTGLDPRGIRTVKDILRARAAAGTAILISSHLLDMVQEMCSSLLIIDRGQQLALGSMAELLRRADQNESLEDAFFRVTERRGFEPPPRPRAATPLAPTPLRPEPLEPGP